MLFSLHCFAEQIQPKGAKTLNGDKTKIKVDATRDKAKIAVSYLKKIDKKNALTFSVSQVVGDRDKQDDFSFDALKRGTKAKISYMRRLTENKDALSSALLAPSHGVLSVAANRESFTIFDSDEWLNNGSNDSAFKRNSKSGYEIGGALQWAVSKYARVKVGYEFQRAYKQKGETEEFCQISEPTRCVFGNTEKIKNVYFRNVFLYWGSYTPKNKIIKGWDLQLAHSFNKSKTRIELPLYLYASKKDNISAGLKFQYLTNPHPNEDSTGVKAFLNVNLDIFK